MSAIALVEPISSGVKLIDAAKAMGLDVFVLSYDQDDRVLPEPQRRQVRSIIAVDTNDEQALTEVTSALHRRVRLQGILPGCEYYVPSVARLNDRLGLPGLSPAIVNALHFKDQMRDRLASEGVRVPRYALVKSQGQLDAAAAQVGFPAVLKPVNSSGSIHVSKVMSGTELRRAYTALQAEYRTDLGRNLGPHTLLETYIDGPEFSVEGHIGTGQQVCFVSITKKLLGPEPHFVELGHIVQADLPGSMVHKIQCYVRQVVHALGVNLGPFHCEIRLGPDGPVLIELAARLAGDRICDLIELALGISLPRIMIESYLGHLVSLPDVVQHCYAGIRFFIAPGSKCYHVVHGIDALQAQAGLQDLEFTIRPGEPVPPLTDFRGRLGHAIFTAESCGVLESRLMAVDRIISFH